MKVEHLATSEQKLKFWQDGEWIEEPDYVEWEYKGFRCEIKRHLKIENDICSGLGHLCGYVTFPKDHPHCTKEDFEFKVHGDITFHGEKDGNIVIGFDCAHAGDLIPYSSQKMYEYMMTTVDKESLEYFQFRTCLEREIEYKKSTSSIFGYDEIYKKIEFVKAECESLVDQAIQSKVK